MASPRYTGSHKSSHSASSAGSYDSSNTQHTASTAPTSYSRQRPIVKRCDTAPSGYAHIRGPLDYRDDPRCSIDTYASTTTSIEEAEEEEKKKHTSHVKYASNVIPTKPAEFGDLFPSTRRMLIRHDTTSDGSMNLRVDTEVSTNTGHTFKMTLFHLRMQDLRERKFSLRRYCRDSGREICNSNRKYARPAKARQQQRPTLQRSLTSALKILGVKAAPASFKRSDPGYESDDVVDLRTFTSTEEATIPTNTIKIEFSNYAHIEVERHKTKIDKRWAFEYWGVPYHWVRAKHLMGFRLVNGITGNTMAHITPELLSKREIQAETSRGGWCPPCSMVISDRSVSDQAKSDLADVIVATGLIALTDDSIRRLAQ
jgi:hypothetical protein